MKKYLLVLLLFLSAVPAQAQMSSLNKAKYVDILRAVVNHKMDDKDLAPDIAELRESERYNNGLEKLLKKLNNDRPSEAKNRRVMRILEQAGKDIYNELK